MDFLREMYERLFGEEPKNMTDERIAVSVIEAASAAGSKATTGEQGEILNHIREIKFSDDVQTLNIRENAEALFSLEKIPVI